MLHESDDDATLSVQPWWQEELAAKKEQMMQNNIAGQVRAQGSKLGLDMAVLEHIEQQAKEKG